MRLVFEFTEGDGCTYSATHTSPVEYKSAEALLVHFMEAAEGALRACSSFSFFGTDYQSTAFFESVETGYAKHYRGALNFVKVGNQHYLPVPPTILTVDEWFARAGR